MATRTMKAIAPGPLALALILVSACGGGGGMPAPAEPGHPLDQVDTFTPGATTAYLTDPTKVVRAAIAAATAAPHPASLTQSSNMDARGVTTDRAEASFTPERLSATVWRHGRSPLSLDTRDHLVESSVVPGGPGPHDRWAQGVLLHADAASITVGHGAVAYDPEDSTDWLAAGYWLRVDGPWERGIVHRAEAGAFVDGPEISAPAELPLTGTASYHGYVYGFYAGEAGSDLRLFPQGSIGVGNYSGSFAARADFAAGTVSASVSDLAVEIVTTTPDGALEFLSAPSPLRVDFGPTPIHSDGSFAGREVEAANPMFSVRASEGSWGGRFSAIEDASGDPRLMTGTHGWTLVTTGGTELSFLGVHHGVTDDHPGPSSGQAMAPE